MDFIASFQQKLVSSFQKRFTFVLCSFFFCPHVILIVISPGSSKPCLVFSSVSSRTYMDKKAGALLDGCHCKGCIDGDSIIRAASRQRRSERGEFVHHPGALALSGGALSRLQPLSY